MWATKIGVLNTIFSDVLLQINMKTLVTKSGIFMAEYIHISDTNSFKVAAKLLKQGAIVALPTDTVYGLACIANNTLALENLFAIKGRDKLKPIAICLDSPKSLPNWAKINHLPTDLINLLLPGPVTLVLKSSQKLHNAFTKDGKVGIRVPNYPFITSVVNLVDVPIALTSANLSNEPSPLTCEELKKFSDKLNAIFDGGVLGEDIKCRAASTVVDLSEPGFYKLVRAGIAHKTVINILHSFDLKSVT